MISPLAHTTKTKPSFAGLPLPGAEPVILNDEGVEVKESNIKGNLCLKSPLPSMARTTFGNHERFKNTYFSKFKGYYFTGDGAYRDEEGNYKITGRVDDVINVSGHRFGTAEIENAINKTPLVMESAVIGIPHAIKGTAIFAFVVVTNKSEDLKKEITSNVTRIIGSIAKPERIHFTDALPKTRSGKIMRRILAKIANGETADLGDISTLLNPNIINTIIKGLKIEN